MSFASPARRETLRARLTLWYVAGLTLTLSAFAFLLYGALSRTLYQHHDEELRADGQRVARLLATAPLTEESIGERLRAADTVPPLLMIRNGRGDLLYRSPLLQIAEPSIGHHEALVHAAARAPQDPEFFTVTLEQTGLVRFTCIPIGRATPAYVQIGSSLGDVPATLRELALASVVLVPLVVVLTSFGGWVISGRALAPITAIDDTLRAIKAMDLSRRVEVHPADRELHGLVGTINGLLARLERAFHDLRNFTADTSHQLRTPLALMNNTIEVARRGAPADLLPLLDDLESEVSDLSAVVADLQMLSLADAEVQAPARAAIDLARVCADAAEIISALGEAAGVSVERELAGGIRVEGDATKLKQVVLNLGDNAVKYSRAGGVIRFRLRREDGHAVVDVEDTGPGIPSDQLVRIFDRFYRASPDLGGHRGTGLGLAIAKRIVEVHGGVISVTSDPASGTRFTIRLPLVA
jgi:signal transduction histidine kinase